MRERELMRHRARKTMAGTVATDLARPCERVRANRNDGALSKCLRSEEVARGDAARSRDRSTAQGPSRALPLSLGEGGSDPLYCGRS